MSDESLKQRRVERRKGNSRSSPRGSTGDSLLVGDLGLGVSNLRRCERAKGDGSESEQGFGGKARREESTNGNEEDAVVSEEGDSSEDCSFVTSMLTGGRGG